MLAEIHGKLKDVTEKPSRFVPKCWLHRMLGAFTKATPGEDDSSGFAAGATWADLYEAQRIRLLLLGADALVFEISHLRATFRLYAGPTLLSHYREAMDRVKSNHADQQKDGPQTAASRAEAMFLLEQIQDIQAYRPHQERKRLSIAYCILRTTFCLILAVGVCGWMVWRYLLEDGFPLGLFMILSLGALGAAFSSLQRIQRSYREGAMILNSTRYMRKFKDWISPPVTGAGFALVASLLFYSGVVGKLTPSDNADGKETPSAHQAGMSDGSGESGSMFLERIFIGSIPRGDFTMVLILAFLAGFAERFVPDTLDRLSGGRANNFPDSPENT